MKIFKALIGLFIVIILGISTYYFIYKPDQTKKLQELKNQFLVQFDLDNINGFTIGKPDSTIIIEKGLGSNWNIIEPILSEAENEEILSLFRYLRETEILFIVDENPDDLSQYDLMSPKNYLATHHIDGTVDTLYIGLNTPDGTMGYVRVSGTNRVLAIDKDVCDYLKRPPRAFRSRRILNIFSTDITAIEIFRNEETIRIENRGINWYLTQPFSMQADKNNIETLLNSIETTRKKHFIAEKASDFTTYGLDNPNVILKVSLKGGTPDKMLLIGNVLKTETDSGMFLFAKQFDQDVIFTVGDVLVQNLSKNIIWYIDKYPMQFNRELANKIVINTGSTEILLVKNSQRLWNAVEPVDKNLDETTISKLYNISRFIQVQDVYSYQPNEENINTAGLDSPRTKISFFQDDTLIDWIEFGITFVEEENTTFVRTSSRPIIYLTYASISDVMNNLFETLFE